MINELNVSVSKLMMIHNGVEFKKYTNSLDPLFDLYKFNYIFYSYSINRINELDKYIQFSFTFKMVDVVYNRLFVFIDSLVRDMFSPSIKVSKYALNRLKNK